MKYLKLFEDVSNVDDYFIEFEDNEFVVECKVRLGECFIRMQSKKYPIVDRDYLWPLVNEIEKDARDSFNILKNICKSKIHNHRTISFKVCISSANSYEFLSCYIENTSKYTSHHGENKGKLIPHTNIIASDAVFRCLKNSGLNSSIIITGKIT
jgi:hypothetical protein